MKSEVPLLGRPQKLDYASAEQAELAEEGRSVEEVARLLVGRLEGLPIWGHPRTQINVVPPPSIPSIIGSLLPAIYNPNLVSDDTSFGLAVTEAAVTAMGSRLVGYDPVRSAGVFTFGGTGTTLYGARLGIEKAFPGAMDHGVRDDGVILASAQSHYCRLNVAGWLGLGEKNVVEVPTHLQNDICMDRLEARRQQGARPGTANRGAGGDHGHHRRVRNRRSRSHRRPARPACGRLPARLHSAPACRRGHRLGVGACSTTTTSRTTRSAFVPARCARSRRRGGASRSSTGPTRSASTSTRPALRLMSPACSWSGAGGHATPSSAAGSRCRTSSRAASATPGVHAGDLLAAARACSPRTPTCISSARSGFAWFSATSSRWRSRCGSTSRGTTRPPCSTTTASAR